MGTAERQPCLHPPGEHCFACCRWCWEDSCTDLTDYIVVPPDSMWRYMPSLAAYGEISHALPERVFSGHRMPSFDYTVGEPARLPLTANVTMLRRHS
jgi:hypothetical protein